MLVEVSQRYLWLEPQSCWWKPEVFGDQKSCYAGGIQRYFDARKSAVLVENRGVWLPEIQLCWWKSEVVCGQNLSHLGGSQGYFVARNPVTLVLCGQKRNSVMLVEVKGMLWPETQLCWWKSKVFVARNPVTLVEVKGILWSETNHAGGSQRYIICCGHKPSQAGTLKVK